VEWSRSLGHSIDSPPAVVDVDADGRLEVVIGTFEGYVFCLKGEDGVVQWSVNVGLDSYIESCPTILDVDGDGGLDVVVAQWQGDCRVYALRGLDGSEVWHSDVPGDWMYHGPSFGDIDGDGLPELAVGCYDGFVYVLNAEDGSLCWSYGAPFYVGAPTCLADLNGDGCLEVVFAAYDRVGVLSHAGSLVWSVTVGGGVFRGVAVGDVDGDGVLDLVFGCDDGVLRAVRGDTGGLVWSVDLGADYGAAFPMDHAPVLADLNGDGLLEVFVVGGVGEYPPTNNYGRAYAVTGGGGGGVGWPMFHHDLVHSGRFGGGENLPPVVGDVSGPGVGRPGVNYSFCVDVVDPEGDAVFCLWDFGDGSQSGWIGPFDSGSACGVVHAWSGEGEFVVRVKACDFLNLSSGWSAGHGFVVDGTVPVVGLVKPLAQRLYLGDRWSVPWVVTVVVGRLTVAVSAVDAVSGVAWVDVVVDGVVVGRDECAPFEVVWGRMGLCGRHRLMVEAVDLAGNRGFSGELVVWKFI
jgi:outer membrane protein assembly factor BamB